uniref:Beta-lactamase-related domain-containing protein n=1 Tax=Plectus sambesii TaxID=2011161 RepID=A0A914XNJ4_9BILA
MASWLVVSLSALIAAVLLQFLLPHSQKLPVLVGGRVDEQFSDIERLFRDEVLPDEREGAAIAVYYKGRLVVDLWGGYAERSALRPWESDTMTVVYSSTKAIGSAMIAMLVSRGHLKYEDLVIKHWPEFGKHGKENVTVDWLMGHKSGIVFLANPMTMEEGNNHAFISQIIENAVPHWPPGTQTGYHAITFGWLIDQLIRRVDPKHRSAAQFYQEEIQQLSQENDFYVGLPEQLEHRVARITNPKMSESLMGSISSGLLLAQAMYRYWQTDGLCMKACSNPVFLSVMSDEIPYNNPRVHQLAQFSSTGIGTARGLASIFNTVLQKNLISRQVYERIATPTIHDFDLVMLHVVHKGHGFMHSEHPNDKTKWIVGHPGNGGQSVEFVADVNGGPLVIAFVRNGLKPGLTSLSNYLALRNAIFAKL